MSATAPVAIICRFNAGQWTASFEGVPQFAFGGAIPLGAIRRLLEGAEADRATHSVQCLAESGLAKDIPDLVVWDPPELLVPCSVCKGRGDYVGLLVVEQCATCGGRSLVPT
jgi:hypothetical protein